jgi:hypothetical protein
VWLDDDLVYRYPDFAIGKEEVAELTINVNIDLIPG